MSGWRVRLLGMHRLRLEEAQGKPSDSAATPRCTSKHPRAASKGQRTVRPDPSLNHRTPTSGITTKLMTSRHFFATVWRINAIILLVVGLLACVVLIATSYLFFKDATRPRHADDVARIAVGGDIASRATLVSFEALPKTAVLRAPLRVTQSYSIGSGSKEASSIRNYLFYEPETRTTRWLKPSMESLIVQTWAVPEDESRESRSEWVSNVYAVVSTDSSGDAALTESDQIQIASSRPDGSGYRVLVEKADRVNEARLLATDRVLVLYSIGEKLFAVEFNPQLDQSVPQQYEVRLPAATR